jgi:outer membrane protein assembly factor BamC
VKQAPTAHPRTALMALALASQLAGCSSIGGLFSNDAVDYKAGTAAKTKALDVPPDLTQLARDSRYQIQGGVVSASSGATAPAPGAAVLGVVAPTSAGGARIERNGQDRWLVVNAAPDALWPTVKAFWEQKGFTLDVEDAKTGVIETAWSMNRAKLPADAISNVLSRVMGRLFDTGERDRFRTRVERVGAGSEIQISHRGLVEILASERNNTSEWRARPSDPQLEAEMLAQLMAALGTKDDAARAAVAQATEGPGRARPVPAATAATTTAAATLPAGASNRLEMDDPFDRAWRRVALALDRGGFTVEDRDRANGIFYVRYVDPKTTGKEEPGFWARLFSDKANPMAPVRYRIALLASGNKTSVTVQTSSGGNDVGENGQRIAQQLVTELR